MKRDPGLRGRIFAEIHAEREWQHQKWGRQALDRNPGLAMFILTEELGEVAKAALDREGFDALQKELIQTAAVCVQWLEDLIEGDREMAWSKVEEMVSGGRMSDTFLPVRRVGPGICPTCGAATECEHWPKLPPQEVRPSKHPTIRVDAPSGKKEPLDIVEFYDNTEQDRLTLGKKR